MAIHTKCEHCGYAYAAPDEMAGRRVRCRQCGLIFALPTPQSDVSLLDGDDASDTPLQASDLSGDTAADFLSPAQPASPYARHDQADTRAMPAMPPTPVVTTSQSNMSGGVGSAKAMMARPAEDPGEFSLTADIGPMTGFRPSFAFNFPFSGELDTWMPRLILALMLFWGGYQAWGWRPGPANSLAAPPQMPSWSGAIPLGLLLLLYAIIWLPLFRAAIRKSSTALKFALPENPVIRAASMASIPFAMGAAFWFGGESVVTAVVGMLLGAGLSLLAAWFLLRLEQKELPFVAIAISVAAVVSMIITATILGFANFALGETVRAMHQTDVFAMSPVGPGMSWDMPKTPPAPPKPPVKPPVTPPVTPTLATAKPPLAPTVPVSAGPSTQPDIAPLVPAANVNDPTAVRTKPVENPGVVAIAKPDEPDVKPTDNPDDAGNITRPEDAAATVTLVPKTIKTDNKLVKDFRRLGIANVQQVVYPLTSGDKVAVISVLPGDRGQCLAELYDLKSLTRLNMLRLYRTTEALSYALSPDGDLLARFSKGFPWEIQIYSFSKRRMVKSFPVDNPGPQVRILGFTTKTNLLVEYRGGSYGLRTIELAGLQRNLPVGFLETPSPVVSVFVDAMRGEAKVAGVVPGQNGEAAALRVFNAQNNRLVQRISIPPNFDAAIAANPTGVAFSPDGRQIAVSYEPDGQLTVLTFALDHLVATHRYIDPSSVAIAPLVPGAGRLPMPGFPSVMNTENRLLALGTDTWLYAGRLVLGVLDGDDKVLGTLDEFSPQLQQKLLGADSTATKPAGPKVQEDSVVFQALVNKATEPTFLVELNLQLPKSK